MALTQRLQIRQSKGLVMPRQLMQAIKLLQLSNLDLAAYVEAELERNPLLDRGPDSESAAARANGAADDGASPGTEFADGANGEQSREDPLEGSLDDNAPARPRLADRPAGYSEWAAGSASPRDDGDYNLESFVSAEPTLADWLREQVTLAITDPVQRMIGLYLVDLVDESGYIARDIARCIHQIDEIE